MDIKTDNNVKTKKNKWLKKLERQSWQLELLLSGFSIVLILQLIDFLNEISEYILINYNPDDLSTGLATVFIGIFIIAAYTLVANLSVHLILRGFWVGIVGLGSVAPNTDFEKLKYSLFFTKKLRSKITNINKLVISIDNICSLIFSFSFLVILLLISLGLYIVFIVFFSAIFDSIFAVIYRNIFIIILLITGTLYFIDFITLGILKKNRIISRIYYPIYWLYSIVTISFIYRTIYYNLISKYSKKRIGFVLFGYLALIFIIPFIEYNSEIFFPDKVSKYNLQTNYYKNQRIKNAVIEKAEIPSNIISDNFFPLFIKYNVIDNQVIQYLSPNYVPVKKEGIRLGIKLKTDSTGTTSLAFGDTSVPEKNNKELLNILVKIYEIYINDSLIINPEFFFYAHQNKDEKGIITMLETSNLNSGKNLIRIMKKEITKDKKIISKEFAYIPFWLQK